MCRGDILDIDESILSQWAADEELTTPSSDAGKRIVTCHGDLWLQNIVRRELSDETLACIDFERSHANFAIQDIDTLLESMNRVSTPFNGKGLLAEDRDIFLKAYLKGCGLLASSLIDQRRQVEDLIIDALCFRAGRKKIFNEMMVLKDEPSKRTATARLIDDYRAILRTVKAKGGDKQLGSSLRKTLLGDRGLEGALHLVQQRHPSNN